MKLLYDGIVLYNRNRVQFSIEHVILISL